MGLRQKLIDAKVDARKEAGITEPLDVGTKSYTYLEADKIARAILETLSEADLTITQLKAPVVLETLKTPDQAVNIKLETLLGDKGPILKALRKLPVPAIGEIVDKLEGEIEKAIIPLLEGGAKLAGLDLGKDSGGLESTGYTFIGEDTVSEENFDICDRDGTRTFTAVKLLPEDIKDFL